MAIRRASQFSINSIGDGLTSQVTITLASAQIFLAQPPEMNAGYSANSALDLAVTKPTDVVGVYCPTGGVPAITDAAITTLGTILQVTFAGAPPANAPFTICGTLVF